MKLCDDCKACLEGTRKTDNGGLCGHHWQLQDYLSALDHGCWVCHSLAGQLTIEQKVQLQQKGDDWLTGPDASWFSYVLVSDTSDASVTGPDGSFQFHLMFDFDVGNHLQRISRDVQADAASPALYLWLQPARHMRIATPAGPSTASPEAWTTASSWIQDCLQNHTACSDNHGVEFCYPTRLLDVGDVDRASDVVCLVETAEQPPQGAYITLSHCWGKMPFLCTTKENLFSMKAGLHVSELAQTFQDAIVVTRRSKVRYLWIDSLCIIQDKQDLSDWNSESVKMESYYSNAFCNLAATASLNGSEGLFRCRDPDRVQHMQYAMPGSRSRQAGLYNIFDITLWEKKLTQAPLHRRAWVLQERLLARRVLHFGASQLMWECHEHTAAEVYPHGIKDVSPLVQRAHFKDLDCYSPWNQAELKTDDPRTLTLRIWERIVNQYSQCLLTYSSDRVKALVGLARRFERMLDDECLFGMWKRDMARQLLWRVEGGGLYPPSNSLYTEQRRYAVPTWSWLSTDCAIDTGKPSEIRQLQSQDILLEVIVPLPNLHSDAHRGLILRCCPLAVTAILGQHGLWRVKKARADNNNNIRGYTKKCSADMCAG
ncbi:hypothetical protein KC315_g16041 [Hortaea werneckii]|nr:hypothetical protein KC315_g16041 [Hortaea werneckii]